MWSRLVARPTRYYLATRRAGLCHPVLCGCTRVHPYVSAVCAVCRRRGCAPRAAARPYERAVAAGCMDVACHVRRVRMWDVGVGHARPGCPDGVSVCPTRNSASLRGGGRVCTRYGHARTLQAFVAGCVGTRCCACVVIRCVTRGRHGWQRWFGCRRSQ